MLFTDAAGRWTAIVSLRRAPEAAAIDAAAVRAAIAAAGVPQVVFLDLKVEIDRLYEGYFDRALAMSAVGLLAIVALLFVALRRPGRGARDGAARRRRARGRCRHALPAEAHPHLIGLCSWSPSARITPFFDRIAGRRDADAPHSFPRARQRHDGRGLRALGFEHSRAERDRTTVAAGAFITSSSPRRYNRAG
jgi:hypothetical protein